MVYVRFRGSSRELPQRADGIDARLADDEILRRLALHLDVRDEDLDNYVVDRTPSGDLVIRPVAVYG